MNAMANVGQTAALIKYLSAIRHREAPVSPMPAIVRPRHRTAAMANAGQAVAIIEYLNAIRRKEARAL